MSRSGYSDDYEGWASIRWRGAVASAIRGKRGQALLREMRDALLALEDKRLGVGFTRDDGCTCALGVVGAARGWSDDDLRALDERLDEGYNREAAAEAFSVADAMTAEIMFLNDEWWPGSSETPERRYERMLTWVESQIDGQEKP